MSETEVFTISIPTDEDGQVLLKCPGTTLGSGTIKYTIWII